LGFGGDQPFFCPFGNQITLNLGKEAKEGEQGFRL
jgi:hypothetical protein